MSSPLRQAVHLADFVKSQALKLGFSECGISQAGFLEEAKQKMENWLADGLNGEMAYLEKNREKRYDPRLLVENAKSVISVLFNYYPGEKLETTDNFRLSKYAYGKDYHYIIKDKLQKLLRQIEEKTGKRKARVFVDSAPVLDRTWAQKSGLGFIGKNTLLINRKRGSFFFIGHIILDLELEYAPDSPAAYCGSCTRCIEACPTGALEVYRLDARKCISYLTIEYRGDALPQELKTKFNDWIFGCDICQDVCPWNRFSQPHDELLFKLTDELKQMRKVDWKKLDKPKFRRLFKGSAVQRTGFKGLKRNIDFLTD
ncbi:MAG: tRNA epoxyqueuosine(34) reductase QueG [Bacteroidales bacterium]|nr:tRNA epoxyqueuosine(34) reductase QueG [Bacteroidales bacterium]MCF6341322.1 tRNA epoxyqueuosine(34) reductase QueG [Bacteroidales bacterium]